MNRRKFFKVSGAVLPSAIFANNAMADDKPIVLATDLVNEFVRKSHFNFDDVRTMLKIEPNIVNACWDWGQGDYETGLGAAAHTGRRNIAELLLEHGARLDLFASTMLGLSSVVRATIEAFPNIHSVPGPHGIPLLSHAVVGGDRSFDLVELLIKQGAAVNAQSNRGMSPLMRAASNGNFDAVKFLVDHDADKNMKDSKGRRAIDCAKQRSHVKIISLLLST